MQGTGDTSHPALQSFSFSVTFPATVIRAAVRMIMISSFKQQPLLAGVRAFKGLQRGAERWTSIRHVSQHELVSKNWKYPPYRYMARESLEGTVIRD